MIEQTCDICKIRSRGTYGLRIKMPNAMLQEQVDLCPICTLTFWDKIRAFPDMSTYEIFENMKKENIYGIKQPDDIPEHVNPDVAWIAKG
jgi:hypothetical protein